jgi:hypothetical protein
MRTLDPVAKKAHVEKPKTHASYPFEERVCLGAVMGARWFGVGLFKDSITRPSDAEFHEFRAEWK